MKSLKFPSPFAISLLIVLTPLIISIVTIISLLNLPGESVQKLLAVMSASGIGTVILSYTLYRRGILQWFNSLRWTLLATTILTVFLVFVNVWVTAQLMFISNHDLLLTTALLIFAGLVSVIAVFFFSGVLTDRIDELSKAAEQLAEGNLNTRLVVQGNDELANLARMFNMMATSLQELDEQKALLEQTRRDLIAWVSHDLRTPLAALRAMNEAIIDGVAADPETTNRYLLQSKKEIEHLSSLIGDLFALSQLDTGHFKVTKEQASIRDLISDTLESMSARAATRQIALNGHVEDGIDMIYIAPDKIQRVLNNLLDNAFSHTPTGGTVTLTALPIPKAIQISVHNTGSYVLPEDLPHIFTRFYKGERSRAQSDNGHRGTGLGLAIARGFVEAHGGTILVQSLPETGTLFSFTLPLES